MNPACKAVQFYAPARQPRRPRTRACTPRKFDMPKVQGFTSRRRCGPHCHVGSGLTRVDLHLSQPPQRVTTLGFHQLGQNPSLARLGCGLVGLVRGRVDLAASRVLGLPRPAKITKHVIETGPRAGGLATEYHRAESVMAHTKSELRIRAVTACHDLRKETQGGRVRARPRCASSALAATAWRGTGGSV